MKLYVELLPEDVGAWYDASSLGERERHLKPVLSGSDLERWFSELHEEDQSEVVRAMVGKPVEVRPEVAVTLIQEGVYL